MRKDGWQQTEVPGLQLRHDNACPIRRRGRTCACKGGGPSYRAAVRDAVTGKPRWTRSTKNRQEAVRALEHGGRTGNTADVLRAHHARGEKLGDLGDEWLDLIERGKLPRRRGAKDKPYEETTVAGYKASWENVIKPAWGDRFADEIDVREWQAWIDGLVAQRDLSRSRVLNLIAVVSGIYAWAAHPSRGRAKMNPMVLVVKPATKAPKERLRIALDDEAERLLAALTDRDAVPYALALYAGLRRAEIHRLQWDDVDWDGLSQWVRKAKSSAGRNRRPPIPRILRTRLKAEWMRQGKPASGPVSKAYVMGGNLPKRARERWGWKREGDAWVPAVKEPLTPITLHDCRHTYATWLMASGHTIKELMTYMGHDDLAATQRYVKLLPLREDEGRADKLNAWLDARAGR